MRRVRVDRAFAGGLARDPALALESLPALAPAREAWRASIRSTTFAEGLRRLAERESPLMRRSIRLSSAPRNSSL